MTDGEGPPETWTDSGSELEMEQGNAYNRTTDPVVWVDARCVPCQKVSVCTLPADGPNWNRSMLTFADYCHTCSVLTPHNVIRRLTGLNRTNDRGRVQRGDADGQ